MIKQDFRLTLLRRMEKAHILKTQDIVNIINDCPEEPKWTDVRDTVRIIANTGVWNEELFRLRIADVDFKGKWLFIGTIPMRSQSRRQLPVRSKTLAAIRSLHSVNPASELVFGETQKNRMMSIILRLKRKYPHLWPDRLATHHLQRNFAWRMATAGLPRDVVKYMLGQLPIADVMRTLALTTEQKLEIVRRNIEMFLPEL